MCVWTAVVESSKLGFLLGKDWLRALARSVDFGTDLYTSRVIGVEDVLFEELKAGHYNVYLWGRDWHNGNCMWTLQSGGWV